MNSNFLVGHPVQAGGFQPATSACLKIRMIGSASTGGNSIRVPAHGTTGVSARAWAASPKSSSACTAATVRDGPRAASGGCFMSFRLRPRSTPEHDATLFVQPHDSDFVLTGIPIEKGRRARVLRLDDYRLVALVLR